MGIIQNLVLAFGKRTFEIGQYDTSQNPNFFDYIFDGNLNSWYFNTGRLKLGEAFLFSDITMATLANFLPGIRITTQSADTVATMVSNIQALSPNLTCKSGTDLITRCAFYNQTCSKDMLNIVANITFSSYISGRIYHIPTKDFVRQVGSDC